MSIDNINMLSSLSENKIENFTYNKEKETDNSADNKQDSTKPTETNDSNEIHNKEEEGITPWRMYLRKTDSKLSLIG